MRKSTLLLVGILLGALVVGGGTYLFLSTQKNPCSNTQSPSTCFMNEVHHVAHMEGIESALMYASDVIAPHGRNTLHIAMHMIGHAAYAKQGSREGAMQLLPQEAFTAERFLIYDGFQHGVLQAYFADKSQESVEELIRESCGEYYGENESPIDFSYEPGLQCFHAVGHALMYRYENDIQKSISTCAGLPYGWMQNRCAFGAFMELSYLYSPAYATHAARPVEDGENIAEVCNSIESLKDVCYLFVGDSYLMKYPGENAGAFASCNAIPLSYRRSCRDYLAHVPIPGTAQSIQQLKKRCESAGKFEEECLLRVALAIRQGYAGSTIHVEEFCASLETDVAERCVASAQY